MTSTEEKQEKLWARLDRHREWCKERRENHVDEEDERPRHETETETAPR